MSDEPEACEHQWLLLRQDITTEGCAKCEALRPRQDWVRAGRINTRAEPRQACGCPMYGHFGRCEANPCVNCHEPARTCRCGRGPVRMALL